MADIELCADPGPSNFKTLEPCVREPGHDGGHYWWWQAPWDQRAPEGVVGVTIWTQDPGSPPLLIRAIYSLEVAGSVTAEEVAALTAYMDLIKKGRHA